MRRALPFACALLLTACATAPPGDVEDLCGIFAERPRWYQDAERASGRWRSPIPVMMAIMHQESRFQARVKPPRQRILWVIPGPRPSTSYGYTQALKTTWSLYIRNTGSYGADRDDFGDSIDFVGWYNYQSNRRSGIARDDPYHLYLAYHEGWGGFNRRSFRDKRWLVEVARKVARQSRRYADQLEGCEGSLRSGERWFGLF